MNMVDITDTESRIAQRVDSAITHNLAISDRAGGVQFANANEVMEWAKMMSVANSGVRKHLRGNPGACLAICVQAVEWGMSSFAVANKSYFVNDQIAFESQLVQAVILKRAPIKGRLKFEFTGEGQNRVCRAWARLRDEDEIVEYVSPAIKDIKVKNSPLWVGDPDQQLTYFAGRSLCRRHFPDVLLGVYTEDDLAPPEPGPDRARDVTPAPKSLAGKFDALAAAPARDAAPIEDAADQADIVVEDAAPDPAKAALIKRLQAKAAKGTDALRRALGPISEDEAALLTDADREALGAAAEEADATKQPQAEGKAD